MEITIISTEIVKPFQTFDTAQSYGHITVTPIFLAVFNSRAFWIMSHPAGKLRLWDPRFAVLEGIDQFRVLDVWEANKLFFIAFKVGQIWL